MEVQAIWKKNYRVEVRARQFNVPIDEAPEFNGEDTGMMPTELFLCSLASCYCLSLVYVAKKKQMKIEDMRVNVIGEKDKRNFIFSRLIVEVESSLPSEDLEDIIDIAIKYCYVSNTVSKSCPIEYVVV
ncbi:MAG TPA: OsmC family protein [Thermodesulfobacteriota bacterium]|jgi:putative redox protein